MKTMMYFQRMIEYFHPPSSLSSLFSSVSPFAGDSFLLKSNSLLSSSGSSRVFSRSMSMSLSLSMSSSLSMSLSAFFLLLPSRQGGVFRGTQHRKREQRKYPSIASMEGMLPIFSLQSLSWPLLESIEQMKYRQI